MKEKILKSNFYQIIIPLDTTLEKIIDKKYSVKEFQEQVFLIEEVNNQVDKSK